MSVTTANSNLMLDIKEIIEPYEEKYVEHFKISCILHTDEKDLNEEDGVVVAHLTIFRDYVNNLSDYIEVTLYVPLGTFIYDVYPKLDNIELTLITTKQKYQGKSPFKVQERYKAVFLVDKNTNVPNVQNYKKEILNQQHPYALKLQLLDRGVEVLRIKTTQGIFTKEDNNKTIKLDEFIHSIVSAENKKILIDNKNPLESIYIEKVDNQDTITKVTIPSLTRIVELPEYLQTKKYGIYNAGLGVYIQKFGLNHFEYKKSFFTYSLYDSSKFDNQEYKMIFFNPIDGALAMTNKITYKYEDKMLRAIIEPINNIESTKEALLMSKGSGFRVSNANSYMKKPVEMTKDGPKYVRHQLNTEISNKDRKDNLTFGFNYGVSNNMFNYTSEILKNQGSYLNLTVNHLDPDFIFPGGACKIVYENKEGKISEIFGVIHSVYITFNANNQNYMTGYVNKASFFSVATNMGVFVDADQF